MTDWKTRWSEYTAGGKKVTIYTENSHVKDCPIIGEIILVGEYCRVGKWNKNGKWCNEQITSDKDLVPIIKLPELSADELNSIYSKLLSGPNKLEQLKELLKEYERIKVSK